MNRRTFLKSTAISLLPSALLLKGEETLKPLEWTSFSSKLPKNKEFFIMMMNYGQDEQHENFYRHLNCSIGMMKEKTIIRTRTNKLFLVNGDATFLINGGTNRKILFPHYLKKQIYYYPIGPVINPKFHGKDIDNLWQWISMTDILKHIKKIPANQLKSGSIGIEIRNMGNYDIIQAGKISKNNQSVGIMPYGNFSFFHVNKIPQNTRWVELPQLPNASL